MPIPKLPDRHWTNYERKGLIWALHEQAHNLRFSPEDSGLVFRRIRHATDIMMLVSTLRRKNLNSIRKDIEEKLVEVFR